MAFSDYRTLSQVQQEFQITYGEADFIAAHDVEPPLQFRDELGFSLEHIDVYTSEAARTEAIIFPILREVYKSYHDHYALWIQKPLAYNDRLQGTPDYLVATRSLLGKTVLELPLVVIVEAKKNDFEQGWGQCLAELVAAQKINNTPTSPVYGIVTDGKVWEFGRLVANRFTKQEHAVTIDALARLFGILHTIFQIAMQGNGIGVEHAHS